MTAILDVNKGIADARGICCLDIFRGTTSRSRRLSQILIFLLISPFVVAGDQTPHVRVSDLYKTPLLAGPLKITITGFRGSFLKLGNGSIQMQVENTSTQFATFSPHLLSFVSNGDDQADVLATWYSNQYLPAVDRKIAPGARIKETYTLTDRVHLPARIYYDEKLLAVISD